MPTASSDTSGLNPAVRALEPRVGERGRSPVSGADHVHHVEIALPDDAIEMRPEKVQPGRGPPVAEEPRFDVLASQRLPQQRVVPQVDLADREVVRRASVGIDRGHLAGITGRCHRRLPPKVTIQPAQDACPHPQVCAMWPCFSP